MNYMSTLDLLAQKADWLNTQWGYVMGDVNRDGVVTAFDITAIYNYLLNGDESFLNTSDVNGDGYINAVDITIIYEILLE